MAMNIKKILKDGNAETSDIFKMTDSGEHTAACLAAAQYINDKDFITIFESIYNIEQTEKVRIPGLSQIREYFLSKMFKVAEKKLPREKYRELYNAF